MTSAGIATLTLLSILTCILLVDSKQWTANTFPNPHLNPQKCGLKRPSTVCDPDHLLKPAERFHLVQLIRKSFTYKLHPFKCSDKPMIYTDFFSNSTTEYGGKKSESGGGSEAMVEKMETLHVGVAMMQNYTHNLNLFLNGLQYDNWYLGDWYCANAIIIGVRQKPKKMKNVEIFARQKITSLVSRKCLDEIAQIAERDYFSKGLWYSGVKGIITAIRYYLDHPKECNGDNNQLLMYACAAVGFVMTLVLILILIDLARGGKFLQRIANSKPAVNTDDAQMQHLESATSHPDQSRSNQLKTVSMSYSEALSLK